MRISQRRMFQVKGTAGPKALRWSKDNAFQEFTLLWQKN